MGRSAELDRSTVEDDPSDWPKEFHELRILDNLLRCSICFEYFNIAVLATGCCHNYCSLCARKYITFKAQCPSCPAEMHPKDLKCNRVLDEIVKIFNMLRPKLLKILKEHSEMLKGRNIQSPTSSKSPYAKAPSTRRRHQATVKRSENLQKLSEQTTGYCSNTSDDDFVLHRTRAMTNSSDFLSGSSTTTLTGSDVESSNESSNSSTVIKKPKDAARCPVCGKHFSLRQINSHLDICLGNNERQKTRSRSAACRITQSSSQSKMRTRRKDLYARDKMNPISFKEQQRRTEETSTNDIKNQELFDDIRAGCQDEFEEASVDEKFSDINRESRNRMENVAVKRSASNQLLPTETAEKRKKLPELVLSGLTDKQTRAKLKAHGISSRGDKKTLQNRLKNFILLYNSQCDAVDPMPVSDIVKEVERGESIRKRLDTKGTTVIHTFDRTKTEEEKEKFCTTYLEKHKSHFQQLIQDVKGRKKNNPSTVVQNHEVSCSTVGHDRSIGHAADGLNMCHSGTSSISSKGGTSLLLGRSSNACKYDGRGSDFSTKDCYPDIERTKDSKSIVKEEGVSSDEEGETDTVWDSPGTPAKPILICDEDEKAGLSCKRSTTEGNRQKQNWRGKNLLLSPLVSPRSSDVNEALSSKLKKRLDSSVKSKQGPSSESARKSKSKSADARPTASQTKAGAKTKSKSKNGGQKKTRARNITSFFEKAKTEKSDVQFIEKPVMKVELSSDNSEHRREISSDDDMVIDGTGNQGNIRTNANDVIEERGLVANPPSPSELDLFDNDYSETMEF